jgi:dCMP deaminase
MLQAKVDTIYFIHDWKHPIDSLQEQYLLVQDKLRGGVRKLDIFDPVADWANGKTDRAPNPWIQSSGIPSD